MFLSGERINLWCGCANKNLVGASVLGVYFHVGGIGKCSAGIGVPLIPPVRKILVDV